MTFLTPLALPRSAPLPFFLSIFPFFLFQVFLSFRLSVFTSLCLSIFVFVYLCKSYVILVHLRSSKFFEVNRYVTDRWRSLIYNFNYSDRNLQYFIGSLYEQDDITGKTQLK